MSRFLPRSLFGQTCLSLLAGLIVRIAVGSWIYTADREQAVRAVGGLAAAQRITNLTRLVQESPRESRERLVAALSDQSFRVSLSDRPPAIASGADDAPVAQAIKDFLVDQLSLGPARQPRVSASWPDAPMFGPGTPVPRGPMMHGFGGFGMFRDLQVAIPLADGQWLSFATALPESGLTFSSQFLLSMGIMAIIILAVSVWAVRRVTAPLASLVGGSGAAWANDLNAPPVPESGTIETQQASRAFNAMQTRLRGLIENRTRMLAAISHDLRTPLTLLRLRAENVENAGEREKMLATIAEMDSMVAATMQFARDEAQAEPRRPTDLAALLASVVHDMADTGLPVAMEPAEPVTYECQPGALKRALTNLLDNAVKYGKTSARGDPFDTADDRDHDRRRGTRNPRGGAGSGVSSPSTAWKVREAARPEESGLGWRSLFP